MEGIILEKKYNNKNTDLIINNNNNINQSQNNSRNQNISQYQKIQENNQNFQIQQYQEQQQQQQKQQQLSLSLNQITQQEEEGQDIDEKAYRQFIVRKKKRSFPQQSQNKQQQNNIFNPNHNYQNQLFDSDNYIDNIYDETELQQQQIKEIVKIEENILEQNMNTLNFTPTNNNLNNMNHSSFIQNSNERNNIINDSNNHINHNNNTNTITKEISSEPFIQQQQQQQQSQFEEDDAQICEYLQKAQDLKENLQHDEAERIYFEALNLQKLRYGNTSNSVASTYKKLGSMFQKKKDYDSSLKYYNEALSIFKCQDGHTSSREATCLISMSNIYLLKENIQEASLLASRALHIYNTQILEDEQMKPLLISQALRLKRKIDLQEKQKQYEEKQIAFSQEQTVCSICLDDIQKNKRVRQLTCGHVYHIKCIAQWLQLNSKCPYCRDVLPRPH